MLHDASVKCSLGALCRMHLCTCYLNGSVLHDVSDTCSLGALCRMHSCSCYLRSSVLHDVSDTCSLGALCRMHSCTCYLNGSVLHSCCSASSLGSSERLPQCYCGCEATPDFRDSNHTEHASMLADISHTAVAAPAPSEYPSDCPNAIVCIKPPQQYEVA